jgi:hypothetical protein
MATKKSDIQDFGSRMIYSYNLAPPTHYQIQLVSLPLTYVGLDSVISQRLNDSLESIILPGRGQNSAMHKTHGPVRDMPYEPLFSGEIEMSFRVSSDYFERDYFEKWTDAIIDPQTMKYNYYKDYTANIKILALDVFENVIYECEVFECYPKTVSPITLAYSQTGELTRFSVSMAFRKYIAHRPGFKTTPNRPPILGRPGEAPPPNDLPQEGSLTGLPGQPSVPIRPDF